MLVLFASAVGLPTGVPIMVVLVLAGASLIGSLPKLAAAIVALAAVELAGTLTLHFAARTGGARLLRRLASARQEQIAATRERWRARLGGRDVLVIAVLRLIPLVRMGTTIGTGLAGMRLRDFVLGSVIAALIWTGVPLTLGYAFRANLDALEVISGRMSASLPPLVLVVAILTILVILLTKGALPPRLGAPTSRPEAPQEGPPGIT